MDFSKSSFTFNISDTRKLDIKSSSLPFKEEDYQFINSNDTNSKKDDFYNSVTSNDITYGVSNLKMKSVSNEIPCVNNSSHSANSKDQENDYIFNQKYNIHFGNKNFVSIEELTMYAKKKFTNMSEISFYQLKNLLDEHGENHEYNEIVIICLKIKLCQTFVDIAKTFIENNTKIDRTELEYLIMDTFGIEKDTFVNATGVSFDDVLNFGLEYDYFSLSNGNKIELNELFHIMNNLHMDDVNDTKDNINEIPCFNSSSSFFDILSNNEKNFNNTSQLGSNSELACDDQRIPDVDNVNIVSKKQYGLEELLSIPEPQSEFNQFFDVLNVSLINLQKFLNYSHVNTLLQHKIAQHIVMAYNERKQDDTNLKGIPFRQLSNFVSEYFNYAENDFIKLVGKNFMDFLRSKIGKKYFETSFNSKVGGYVIDITTAKYIYSSYVSSYDHLNADNANIKSIQYSSYGQIKGPIIGSYANMNAMNNLQCSNVPDQSLPTGMMMLSPYQTSYIKPKIPIHKLDPSVRCAMGKIMIYYCYYLALPRNEICTSYFKENMSNFSGYLFNKDWYKLVFSKTVMSKMFSEIFYDEIVCKTGSTGGAVIFCNLSDDELWNRIEVYVDFYNRLGAYRKIDLETLRLLKEQNITYYFDCKNWIPYGKNCITLFGFDARGIYE
uniref:HTH OST-type domain-containing protein n=1 Tax=Parastrongyloides trichosuri TaxID=131310 RepID=A0A0N4ZPM2_PARTI